MERTKANQEHGARWARIVALALLVPLGGCSDQGGRETAPVSVVVNERESNDSSREITLSSALMEPELELDRSSASRDQGRDIAICLVRMFKLARWPETSDDLANRPLVVGVVGGGILFNLIDGALMKQSVEGRPLEVRRMAAGDEEGMGRCHLLYCESVDHLKSAGMLGRLGTGPVLTVSAEPGFIERGGMVQIDLGEGKPAVTIHWERAKEAGLDARDSVPAVRDG